MSQPWRTDDETRTVYATDNSIYQLTPAAVALPRSAADVASILRNNAASPEPKPIVARGGGTGTNGQSLTTGLSLDVKRHLNQLLEVDQEQRLARVQPGIVTDALNEQLRPLGLHWAPHTSTTSRATVGGMIATDAAGKGSLIHGRANRHVAALDVILADGTPFRAEPTPVTVAQERAERHDTIGTLWRALLAMDSSDPATLDLPELARGFSGYGIDRLRPDPDTINPVPLLVGSEGTLAVITEATLKLTPLPAHTRLVVASYPSFDEALADAVELRATKPAAIETFDERTLEAGRASPAWAALGSVVGDHNGSVLLLEYAEHEPGNQPPNLEPVFEALHTTGRSRNATELETPAARAQAWKVRADAVGLLAKVEIGAPQRTARPTAFVEDCAVPVAAMRAFIADYRAALDSFGLTYAMFGHADVGCVHVRPALDTTDPEHEQLVRAVTDRVVEIVQKHGGVLWGEHGRGFRGESVDTFLTPETINLMRQVKTAFDPDDLLNPGKLYRPFGSNLPLVKLDEPPLRGHANRSVPVAIRHEYAPAFACNGNGLCHHHSANDPMCPSYKVDGDPALSPKGRADLIREWLRRREAADTSSNLAAFEEQLATNLGQCLSCSACSGRCPVEVDIPELKSKFLDTYYSTRRRPSAHAVLSRFEQVAMAARHAPAGLTHLGAGPAGKLLGLVDLPTPKGRARNLPPFDQDQPTDLVLLQDVFTAALEPATLEHTHRVLTRLGYKVTVAPFVASGKFDHVKGKRAAFAKAVKANRALVDWITAAGARPVAIEPATSLLHHNEYRAFDADYPSGPVINLAQALWERRERFGAAGENRQHQSVRLLAHCTERATAPAWVQWWTEVLEAAGFVVDASQTGCCGMAGIFGHEAENQRASTALWERSWAAPVQASTAANGLTVATGYSCRSQAARLAKTELLHPVHLL